MLLKIKQWWWRLPYMPRYLWLTRDWHYAKCLAQYKFLESRGAIQAPYITYRMMGDREFWDGCK